MAGPLRVLSDRNLQGNIFSNMWITERARLLSVKFIAVTRRSHLFRGGKSNHGRGIKEECHGLEWCWVLMLHDRCGEIQKMCMSHVGVCKGLFFFSSLWTLSHWHTHCNLPLLGKLGITERKSTFFEFYAFRDQEIIKIIWSLAGLNIRYLRGTIAHDILHWAMIYFTNIKPKLRNHVWKTKYILWFNSL